MAMPGLQRRMEIVGAGICDFCMSPRPAWCYPAMSFLDALGSKSVGDWLACAECHGLIEAGDRDGLLERAIRHVDPPRNAREADATRWYIGDLHVLFRAHRTGPARRIAV